MKNLYYGWVIVAASAIILAVSVVMFSSFGIFLEPITEELNWDRGTLSTAFSISVIIGGFLGIITGRLNDKFGPRPLVTTAAITSGLGFILLAQISSLWQAYLVWGVLMPTSIACCIVPIIATIPRWFNKNRGMATVITMVGMGIGGIVWPIICQWLIETYGWRQAYTILGLITLVAILLLAQFLSHSPQRKGFKAFGEAATTDESAPKTKDIKGLTIKQAIKAKQFWLFGMILLFYMFCIQSATIHIVPYATDIGILGTIAAGTLSLSAATTIIGQLLTGFASDRIDVRKVLVANLAIAILAFIWLLFASDVWSLYIFAVLMGITLGIVPLQTLITAELFGLKHIGAIVASITLFATIGSAIGPVFAGFVYDATGSYNIAFSTCSILCVLAFFLSLLLLRSKEVIKGE